MKKLLLCRTGKLFGKALLPVLFFVGLTGLMNLHAQVNFVQTTNADFNKGVLNNVAVSGDNITLQNAASDVGTWLTTTVLPQTLSGHKTVSWNDKYVYLLGGYNGMNYSSSVYVGTIQSGGISNWTALNSLPVAMKDPAVVIGTNTIYVMGGRNASQIYNTIYYAAINTDGSIGAWQTSAVNLPVALWGHSAVYLKGYIYVTGGSSSTSENTALTSVYYAKVKADNTLSSFSAGNALTQARNKHTMVTYNSNLYVMGGYNNTGVKASTVYVATPGLDGSTGTWSAGTSLPVAVSNHSSVVTNGLITVMAGATGTGLTNTVYYANADISPLSWSTSTYVLYDNTKDGAAFQGNGLVFYGGGENNSGTPIMNCRYANLTLTANYVNHGVFVSNPFYELGAERLINSLTFTATYNAGFSNCQVSYRTAGSDAIWGNWTAVTATSPVTVNLTKQYLQYAVISTSQTTYSVAFNDMTLTTPGTQLTGNLNAITTFTQALSPYWATGDISFTGGTHTFQAGTTILFLPGTGMTVNQANIICNGTVADSVKFLYFTTGINGQWNGIYFDPESDNGVSSQFYYTVIGNAGYGSNNANLYCYATNEPLLSNCRLRNADGNGLRLNSAHITIQNTNFKSNTENGAYLENSNPSFSSCTLSYNGGGGVHYTSTASVPTYSSTTIDHNLYGFHFPSPNLNFYPPSGSPTLIANTYNGFAIDGGSVTSGNKRWNAIPYDYILLGTVTVMEYYGNVRLTIEPGNIIKAVNGAQLQIGTSQHGGELYALGTADSLITFTSWNGLPGGWNGIYFHPTSENWGGQSQLDYCVIEKGNEYNYYSESTTQPNLINHSKIQNALLDGARYSSSYGSITNCQFLNNGRYPLYYLNTEADPVHTNNTYSGNVINRIALSGGNYNGFHRTITNDGIPYYILNDTYVIWYYGNAILTINPGVTLEFAAGKKLQIGQSQHGGSLNAQGTSGNPIIFKAFTNTPGGWEGIYFHDNSDSWGASSVMTYCTITQGNSYNLYCEYTTQPSLDHCTISNSALHGVDEYASSGPIHNCQFLNNNGYPLKYEDWTCNSHLSGNTYTGNSLNYIALSGGSYTSDRTLYNDGIPYHVLGDISVIQYYGYSRLTVKPGITLAFNPGLKLQLGTIQYGGGIYAEGKSDSVITFKPYNNAVGGWNGIYFHDNSDSWGATSSLKYCNIEKGANYNIYAEYTSQPTIDHCTLTKSTGNGLNLYSCPLIIKNSTFTYNAANGILIDGSSTPTIGNDAAFTCNFYNNVAYNVSNNSGIDINARYNYWGTGDSAMIASKIYDKSDNIAKGYVYFGNFAQLPAIEAATMVMSGTVKYSNTALTPLQNAVMTIKNFAGTTIATTTTNTSGVYTFSSIPSGNYRMTIVPSNAWGGANSTDALLILNHFVQSSLLTGMKLAAADVNNSHAVNATDAFFVMSRYSELMSSFPAGDYLYNTDTVYVNGSQVTNNFEMLCFGDVNASYLLTKKDGSISLDYNGYLRIPSFTDFNLPVKIKTGAEIGAISLGFYYPEEYLEITGAEASHQNSSMFFSAIDGMARMAWADTSPIIAGDEDIIVTLKLKTRDLSGLQGNLALQLYEDSELADKKANVIDGVNLEIAEIQTTFEGISEPLNGTGLSVFPNPMQDQSVIELNLLKESRVKLTVFNIMGNLINVITDAVYQPGNQQFKLDGNTFSPGIYLLKMEISGSGQAINKTIKVVVSK